MTAVVVLLLLLAFAALAVSLTRRAGGDASRRREVERLAAALDAARSDAERNAAEALAATERLQDQTMELEQQIEEAQGLAEELEQSNAELSAALETAEASEARFRRMFAESPLPMWVYDPDTLGFLDVNAAAVAAYGFTRHEFLGMTLRDIRPPEDVPRLLDVVRTQSPFGRVVRGSHRHRGKDGTLRDVELTAQDTQLHGRVARLVVVFDVTEQLRVAAREHFLAEASGLLGALTDVTGALAAIAELAVPRVAEWCAVDLLDAEGTLHEATVSSAEGVASVRWLAPTVGDAPRQPVPLDAPRGPMSVVRTGDTTYEPALTRERAATLWPGAEALAERSLIVVPVAARGRRFGALTLLSALGRRYAEADCAVAEEIGRHAGLAIDNAERYASEHAAREAAEASAAQTARLQAVTAELSATLTAAAVARVIVHHGIAAVGGMAGSVWTVEERTKELVVLDAAGYADGLIDQFLRVPLDASLPVTDAVRTGEAVVIDTWAECLARYPALASVSESARTVAIAAIPLMVDGRRVGALGVTFDGRAVPGPAERSFLMAIAQQCAQALERARLYEAEEKARSAAEGANRAKSDFLATMSHELRTPLNAIAGFAQLLQDGLYGPLSTDQQGVIRRIDRAQRHLLGLINDVLNYAKLEAGKVQFHVSETDLGEVVAEAAAIGEAQLAAKRIALTLIACPDVAPGEPITVWADEDKLRQVLLNLLSNATKFTPAGGRVIVECLVTSDDERDHAMVRVTDTGIGIAEEKLEAVFEPFVQVDTSRTREHQGTGLGLAISRDLARGMGGDLTASSVPGEGSSFTLALRRAVTGRGERTERRAREDRRAADRRQRGNRRGD